MINGYRSEDELEQGDSLLMINFKIFLEYSLKSGLDEIKQIIFRPAPEVPETVHHALPDRITLQHHQVLPHQLTLPVPLVVHQLPDEVEVDLLVSAISGLAQQFALRGQDLVKHFRRGGLLVVLPLEAAEATVADPAQLLPHEVLAVDGLPVEEVDRQHLVLGDLPQREHHQRPLYVDVGAVGQALVLKRV
jgi:hypothetical protein